jgi:fucose 4-O-acetylase-like acetyltransferase
MNNRIENLRGLACVLLVAYHVVGADPARGLCVETGPLRWLNDGLAYLRMPLFTFLSGLVYGLRPFAGNSRVFLVGKARRLLVPMLVVGTIFAIAQALTPGTHDVVGAWYTVHLLPVAHFWFVESLFWVFVVVWLLERGQWLSGSRGFGLLFLSSCLLYLSVRGWPWLGVEGAIYLLPYFLVGLAVSRFPQAQAVTGALGKACLLAMAAAAILTMGLPVPDPERRTVPMLLAGVSLCLLVLGSGLSASWLARVGRFSYAIYIFHVFFTASARISMELLGVDNQPVDLVLGLSLGLAGPMLVASLASRHRWTALLLLGQSVPGRRWPGAPASTSAA